ncbi:hypothetical protein BOTBODRAFT_169118 [Botryobasidium botryosum FD-172 SS1]|uniref:Uncharacterized protein n=1 Tax=Botryobasidium botryosum (strain FD-172 SS1) TaxID=930990 RepID=A0A067N273_BOTB1|nr:hypothetical protein BOTBODRAFT_169118 [Botryobasidium botryosum FD-172 SS1]
MSGTHAAQPHASTETEWSFSLRAGYADSDEDEDDVGSGSVTRTSGENNDALLAQSLDLASREETVQFKANPWSIAKLNAASRPKNAFNPQATAKKAHTSSVSSVKPSFPILDALKKQAAKPARQAMPPPAAKMARSSSASSASKATPGSTPAVKAKFVSPMRRVATAVGSSTPAFNSSRKTLPPDTTPQLAAMSREASDGAAEPSPPRPLPGVNARMNAGFLQPAGDPIPPLATVNKSTPVKSPMTFPTPGLSHRAIAPLITPIPRLSLDLPTRQLSSPFPQSHTLQALVAYPAESPVKKTAPFHAHPFRPNVFSTPERNPRLSIPHEAPGSWQISESDTCPQPLPSATSTSSQPVFPTYGLEGERRQSELAGESPKQTVVFQRAG